MPRWTNRTSGLAVTLLFASCIAAAAQDSAAREKLRTQSAEFRNLSSAMYLLRDLPPQ